MTDFLTLNPSDNPNEGRIKTNYNFSLISGITLSNYLSLSGGTVTGSTYFTRSVTFSDGIYGNGSGLTNINEVNVVNQFSKISIPPVAPLSVTLNLSNYRTFMGNLVNNANLNILLSNFMSGNSGSIILKQNTSGNSTVTLTGASYNNYVINGGAGAITLSNSANAIDILRYLTDGTNVYWTVNKQFT